MSILQTQLYRDLRSHLDQVRIVDMHEHLMRETQLPTGDLISFSRLFMHYTSADLVSCGAKEAEVTAVTGAGGALQKPMSDASKTPTP